jgi:hypothetical protein
VAFVEDNETLSDSNVFARLSLAGFLETSTAIEIADLASHFYEIERDLQIFRSSEIIEPPRVADSCSFS